MSPISSPKWGRFSEKLAAPIRTAENVTEYAAFSAAAKRKAKDHGGFVGGSFQGGKRSLKALLGRAMLTLDADEYAAIASSVAEGLGIGAFDPCSLW